MPPLASGMKKNQLKLIKTALSEAFEEGHTFKTCEAVIEYLKETGVSGTLLSAHVAEIFTCYLGLQDELRKVEVLSPPPSEGSPIRASDQSDEGDDCVDGKRIAPPVFHSEDTVPISFFRSRMNNFSLVVAKICEGRHSYISENAVRRNYLDRDKPNIVLQWRYPQEDKIFSTRCIVVKAEVLPNCEVALGEDFGKEDQEELEEEQQQRDGDSSEENMNISNESILNDDIVKYEPLGPMSPRPLSPQEESNSVRILAALNAQAALHLLRLTSPPPQPLPLTSDRLHEQEQSRLSRRSAGSRKMS